MEFFKAIIAMWLFSIVMLIMFCHSTKFPSQNTQTLALAIVAAGALAHSEK